MNGRRSLKWKARRSLRKRHRVFCETLGVFFYLISSLRKHIPLPSHADHALGTARIRVEFVAQAADGGSNDLARFMFIGFVALRFMHQFGRGQYFIGLSHERGKQTKFGGGEM